jgi:hypothetical protein
MKRTFLLSVIAVFLLLCIALYIAPGTPTEAPRPETAYVVALTAEELAAENAAREARAEAAKIEQEAARIARLWSKDESVDSMTGKPVVNLQNRSTYSFPLDFPHRGMHYAYIVVRKHPRYGTDAMITVDEGQLHCQYRNCRILVRFDQGKPTSFSVSGPADNSSDTWFIDDTSRFIGQLSRAKNVIVELQFYQQGIRELKFETTGFKRP